MFREDARRRLEFLLEHGWTEHASPGEAIEYRTTRTRLIFRVQPARGAGTHRIAGWFGNVGDRSLLPLEELHPLLGHNRYLTGDLASYGQALDGLRALLLDHGRELVADRPGLVDELTAARERATGSRATTRRAGPRTSPSRPATGRRWCASSSRSRPCCGPASG